VGAIEDDSRQPETAVKLDREMLPTTRVRCAGSVTSFRTARHINAECGQTGHFLARNKNYNDTHSL